MVNFHQSTVHVLYVTPTVLPPSRVRNCEFPLAATPFTFLFLHKMGVEAVSKLDLTKHDVTLVHLVGVGDREVGGLIATVDPRIQRPARPSVAHGAARQQLLLDRLVPM